MSARYPVFLDVTGKRAVVVGGGPTAEEKIRGLLAAGAVVTVVSPELGDAVAARVRAGEVAHRPRAFRDDDVEGAAVVIAATDRRDVNLAVAATARARGVLVNVVDTPEACDFYVPAVVRRGALQVAISTDGRSPALAAHVRGRIETMLGAEYAAVVDVLGDVRDRLRRRGDSFERRRRFLERLLAADLVATVASGDAGRVEALIAEVDAAIE